jgi:hypothetical protein
MFRTEFSNVRHADLLQVCINRIALVACRDDDLAVLLTLGVAEHLPKGALLHRLLLGFIEYQQAGEQSAQYF